MNEKLVIIPRKNTGGHKAATMLFFVLTCLCLIMAMFVTPVRFFVPTVIFGIIWYLFAFRSEVEYEYTYYDGELHFAKISNKSRRKKIADINMEDVILIAPKGDRGVYKYENDRSVTCKNLTSGNTASGIYELICKGESAVTRYEFEPDDAMLDAIAVKYQRVITR